MKINTIPRLNKYAEIICFGYFRLWDLHKTVHRHFAFSSIFKDSLGLSSENKIIYRVLEVKSQF